MRVYHCSTLPYTFAAARVLLSSVRGVLAWTNGFGADEPRAGCVSCDAQGGAILDFRCPCPMIHNLSGGLSYTGISPFSITGGVRVIIIITIVCALHVHACGCKRMDRAFDG